MAEQRDGVLLAPETPRPLAAVDGPSPAPAARTTCASSSAAASTTAASRSRPRRRWLLWPRARPHVHLLDLDRLGAGTGSRLKVSSAHGSLTMEVEADARMAWCGLAAVQPPGLEAVRLLAGADGVIDVRLENPS